MSQNVVAVHQQPRSVLVDMAGRYGMEPTAFEATVRATCMAGQSVSREQFAAFLLVAKEYGLNPLTKEIYAFPSKGGIQPIVSIDGWMSMINNHPACDGLEFEDHIGGDGKLEAITCRIYRKDRNRPTSVTEYMAECRRNTDVWRQWPARMLRHKAAIQCGRYAFGFSGIMEPDEWERAYSVSQAQPTGLRDRLASSRHAGPVGEGFTATHTAPLAHSGPETAEDARPAPAEGQNENASHEATGDPGEGWDDADNIREPEDDGFPGDTPAADPTAATLMDLKAALESAQTPEDVSAVKTAFRDRLNALKGGDRAKARDLLTDAEQRVGGGP